MPTVLRINGYRFFFYSNEHLPIHIEKDEKTAKFNLQPIEIIYTRRFKASEISEIRKLVVENSEFLIQQWNEYFNN
ncbi:MULTISPECIES: DUF4160 domain-containing protein [Mesonia]|uniref:Uncharacterized protein n=1 Tax=Mesonia oceanica TaxID=2687242 RepID=A0AC61YB71_9FLAO|nr:MULTISPECIES: DUF4160 domain-containing protein [Mesonia]MAN29084.1 hypothetical protein [Mesonia sp.]MAQ41808.1 hypothetical protein [Mesonia sp.]MBJ98318.1 hypothetical protein [Flavobacteriaceae bacterium]VVV01752.1 hypothetical protein FVB9532_03046 [Mesonia oceanica]|tara:strand:- start:250 stop:477 length:228 start_codon:yes stop_codon:yes gene_type:complete